MYKKYIKYTLFSLLVIIFSFKVVFAQTSIIEGLVQDAKTHEALPGVNVFLKGTYFGASTDAEGRYLITNVPEGKFILEAQYIGYKNEKFEIEIKAGKRIRHNILLKYNIIEGDEITVTAQAEGQIAAINQQLSSKAIVNVVSSARIQEIPDDNAAESVGRLPGVSILRKGGEGNKVVIRGLSPKYNNVMVNGVKMAATDTDDRSVDLSMISPYMLEGIEVIKAVTPDMDADAIGGTVNFQLRKAKPGLNYDLLFQGGYNNLHKSYNNYKAMANIGKRFFNEKFGIFTQIDIENRNRSSNNMGAGYELVSPSLDQVNKPLITGLSLSDIDRIKNRNGATLVLDYKIPDGRIVQNNFYSVSNTQAVSRGQSFGIDLSTHDYTTVDSDRKLSVLINSLDYNQMFKFVNINAMFSHSYSKQNSPDNLSFNFNEVNAFDELARDIPPIELPNYARNDLDNTVFANIFESDDYSKDRELTGKIDFDKTFNLMNSLSAKIKLGGKYVYRDREYDYNASGGFLNYGSGQGARDAILTAYPWMQDEAPLGSSKLPFPLFIDYNYTPNEFLKGKYDTWPSANVDLMHGVINVLKNYGESEAYRHLDLSSTLYDYSGNEYLKAGYLMFDFQYANIVRLIAGARYENMQRKYTAIQGNSTIGRPETHYSHIDTTTDITNEYLLPMVNLKIKPLDWFDIRFSYTNTLSRPDFIKIVPRLNIGRETVSRKDYELNPTKSENYDLYLSFYQNNLGLLTIGGFKKKITDMIFALNGRVILDPEEIGLDPTNKGKKLYTDLNNPFPVDLWGVETSWQTNFVYLPGILRGLVLDINYTHIFSEAKYPRSIVNSEVIFEPPWIIQTVVDTFYTARLIDQPDDIVNVAFGLDYKGFSVRVSMLYQSNIFKGANFWPELRNITDDYLRWDMSLKQKLPVKGLMVFLNIRNISGSIDRNLNMGSGYPTSEQYYGTGADIGLRYRIN